jgi:hypothetical protein
LTIIASSVGIPLFPAPSPRPFDDKYWYHLYENPAITNSGIPWERSLGDLLWEGGVVRRFDILWEVLEI